MSADACAVYYGFRYEVPPGEVVALEERSDSRVVAARRAGLKYYWGDTGDSQYVLLIGIEIAVLGPENALKVSRPGSFLAELNKDGASKLMELGFDVDPNLHFQWFSDF